MLSSLGTIQLYSENSRQWRHIFLSYCTIHIQLIATLTLALTNTDRSLWQSWQSHLDQLYNCLGSTIHRRGLHQFLGQWTSYFYLLFIFFLWLPLTLVMQCFKFQDNKYAQVIVFLSYCVKYILLFDIVGPSPTIARRAAACMGICYRKPLQGVATESGTSVRSSFIGFQALQKVVRRIQKMK